MTWEYVENWLIRQIREHHFCEWSFLVDWALMVMTKLRVFYFSGEAQEMIELRQRTDNMANVYMQYNFYGKWNMLGYSQ